MYLARVADQLLSERSSAVGAVVIEGPRAAGKTELARNLARSEVLLDVDANARALAEISPDTILRGDRPRLIDEWQLVPSLWDHVRREVDRTQGEPGQFILTGSVTPESSARLHTGTGRISRLRMRTLSLAESGYSVGQLSLRALLEGRPVETVRTEHSLEELLSQIARGGWPASVRWPDSRAFLYARDYARSALELDVAAAGAAVREPRNLEAFMLAYAQVTGSPMTVAKLLRRAFPNDVSPVTPETAERYRAAAERAMLIEDLPAWSPTLRSRSRLTATPKRYFTDPSLAVAYLQTEPTALLNDLATVGLLFENLVIRDLRVYADAMGWSAGHYRELDGRLEADVVLSGPAGRWAACEVKLGQAMVEEAAANLLRLSGSRASRPADLLAVIVPTGFGYRRPDGVWVLPIDQLGP